MACKPAILIDGFPYLLACDTGYWLFRYMAGDRPVYGYIPTTEAVRLMYVARRLPGAKVEDEFFNYMKRVEHRQVSREVMKAAMRTYSELRREFPDVPRRQLLSAVLKAAWELLREKLYLKGNVFPELYERAKQRIMRLQLA